MNAAPDPEAWAGELLTVLKSGKNHDGTRPHLGKRIYLRDGAVMTESAPKRKYFDAREVAVGSLEELDRVLRDVAGAGDELPVMGRLIDSTRVKGIRRLKNANVDCAATLRAFPRRLWMADVDDVLNVLGLDPRLDDATARALVLSFLPRAIRRAKVLFRWSSSICAGTPDGTPPKKLSAHVWFLLDEAATEEDMKALTLAADARAHVLVLERTGRPHAKRHVIDPKVTEPHQCIYVAPPLFGRGLSDPLPPEVRQVLLPGTPTVCLAELREELSDALAGLPASKPKATSRAKAGAPKLSAVPGRPARPARAALPLREVRDAALDCPLLHAVVESCRLDRDRVRSDPAKTRADVRRVDVAAGNAALALDLCRLVVGRVAWGADHPELAAWTAAGGVPDGERDMWLCTLASTLAAACPPEAITDGLLAAAIEEVGTKFCGAEWYRTEWVAEGYGASVMSRARDAAAGWRVEWRGRLVDPRYHYSVERLLAEHAVGVDECLALGLTALAPAWASAHNRRRALGARTRLELAERNGSDRAKALRMLREGASRRTAATRLGISHTRLGELLNAPPPRRPKCDFILAGVGFQGGVPAGLESVSRFTCASEACESEAAAEVAASVAERVTVEEAGRTLGEGKADARRSALRSVAGLRPTLLALPHLARATSVAVRADLAAASAVGEDKADLEAAAAEAADVVALARLAIGEARRDRAEAVVRDVTNAVLRVHELVEWERGMRERGAELGKRPEVRFYATLMAGTCPDLSDRLAQALGAAQATWDRRTAGRLKYERALKHQVERELFCLDVAELAAAGNSAATMALVRARAADAAARRSSMLRLAATAAARLRAERAHRAVVVADVMAVRDRCGLSEDLEDAVLAVLNPPRRFARTAR